MTTIAQQKPADQILVIDAQAKAYADERAILAGYVTDFDLELQKLRRKHLPAIRRAAARCADLQAGLQRGIEAVPELFTKPRTMTLHGIKVGFQKGKGRVEWEDGDKVVERIRAQFSKSQAELMLDVKTTPRKDALLTLDVATLKKLGVTVSGTGDAVFIKAANSEVDKFVAQLLAEGSKTEEGEA